MALGMTHLTGRSQLLTISAVSRNCKYLVMDFQVCTEYATWFCNAVQCTVLVNMQTWRHRPGSVLQSHLTLANQTDQPGSFCIN